MRILHFASYDANIGDSSTIYSVRKQLEDLQVNSCNIEWTRIDGKDFHPTKMEPHRVIEIFSKHNINNHDLMIIGGGGQIEARSAFHNKFTLPFNEKVLDFIDIPITCVGLGINTFRDTETNFLCQEGFKNFCLLIERSKYFSLRNDGSCEIAKKMFDEYDGSIDLYEKIKELPDPGLIFEEEIPRKQKLRKVLFQPARNSGANINIGRGLTGENLQKLSNFLNNINFIAMPHTTKDYKFFNNEDLFCMNERQFSEHAVKTKNYAFFMKNAYFQYDMSIAMRGHGQLNAIAINLPSLYFSTQDKVRDFSYKNGFGEYNIDIRENNWDKKLKESFIKMTEGGNYLNQWYEIRDEKMKIFKTDFKECIREVKDYAL